MNNKALIEGEQAAKESILQLLAMGSLKLVVGLFSGMSVLIADAINTITDTLGLFASYIGLHLSRKTANKKFAYGYYKVETFAALLISIGTLFVSYAIISDAFTQLSTPSEGQYRTFAITTAVIGLYQSKKLAKKLQIAGEKTNSLSLIANAQDKRMDYFSGIAVLISIIANYQGIPYLEGIVTIGIGLIALKEGIVSTKESLFFLLDYWDDPKLARKIRAIFKKEKDLITKVKKLKLRRAGTFIFGEAFVEINPLAGMEDLREELDILNKKIHELDPYLRNFSIYSHISKLDKVKVAVPIKSGRSLNAIVANNLKETHAYLFARIRKGKIREFYIKKLDKEQKKGVGLGEFLKKEKAEIVIDNKLNSLIYYNLRRTHHILIYPNFSNVTKVKPTLELLVLDT